MLSPSKYIATLIFSIVLVFSTSTNAELYGFSSNEQILPSPNKDIPPRNIINYRKAMRDLIIGLSQYGKSRNSDFQIIQHEGQYLLDKSMWEYHRDNYNQIRNVHTYISDESFLAEDVPSHEPEISAYINKYISSLDGIVVNNHYCHNTPISSIMANHNIPMLSIEQCPDNQSLDTAILNSIKDKNAIYPFINVNDAFRKSYRQLIINENADNITHSNQAKNISFILNDELFSDYWQMIKDINNSNYDIIVIRPLFQNNHPFSPEEVYSMKYKKNGARRLIIALINISEISSNSYLWKKQWEKERPDWILSHSQIDNSGYIVKYWSPEWKKLISHYFKSIVDSNYDGVFITGLENHRYFENELPLE